MTELNAGQKLAVESNSKHILCLAGAGTGKTLSLIERIIRIARTCDPTSILALTFTNNAAFEMRSRYLKQLDSSRVPEFRTFHGFCFNLISTDYAVLEAIGYRSVPKIIDPNLERKLRMNVQQQLNIKLSQKKLDGGVPLTPKEQYEFDNYQKQLHKLYHKDGGITFNMLLDKVCNLFIEDHPAIQKYKSKYKYIFVDEFQDTDPLQWKFVQTFEDANIFCVGDALQSIYGFRGASSKYIKDLSVDPNWEVVRLTENYRSTTPIITIANEMSDHADSAYRLDLTTTKEGGSAVFDEWLPDWYGPGGDVDNKALDRIIATLPQLSGSTALLFRTNKEVANAVNHFNDANINVSTNNSDEDAQNFVKSVMDKQYMIDWLSSLLSMDRAAQFMRLVAIQPDKDPMDILYECIRFSDSIKYRYDTILAIQKTLLEVGVPASKKARHICELIGYPDLNIVYPDPNKRPLSEILLEALEVADESNIYIGTVHSSKGLEYENVFLCGVGGKSFPLKTEEDYNLRYVGVTRARTNLVILEGIAKR